MDAAHKKVCLHEDSGLEMDMESTFSVLRHLLASTLTCAACPDAAVYICGRTDVAEGMCERHCALHSGCGKDNVTQIAALAAYVINGEISSVKPDFAFVERALFKARTGGGFFLLQSADMDAPKAAEWKFTLEPLTPTAAKQIKVSLRALKSDYEIVSVPTKWQQFCALSESWMVSQHYEILPLSGLARNTKVTNRLTQPQYDAAMQKVRAGDVDGVILHLLSCKKGLCWMPSVTTLDPATREKEHVSGPLGDFKYNATPEVGYTPFSFGKRQLSSWRFGNTVHAGAHMPEWPRGSGIGVSELFIGLPNCISGFMFHGESLGCDFVNVLADQSDAVCWKFLPMESDNTAALAAMQSACDPRHRRMFYKGVFPAAATLREFRFGAATVVIQQPTQIVGGHSYHFGVGGQKLAEAHSWFSGSWGRLQTTRSNQLPVTWPDVTTEAADDDMPAAKKVKMGSGMTAAAKTKKP